MTKMTKNVSVMMIQILIPVAAKGQTEVGGLKEVKDQAAVMGRAAVKAVRDLVEVEVPKAHAVRADLDEKKARKVEKVLRVQKEEKANTVLVEVEVLKALVVRAVVKDQEAHVVPVEVKDLLAVMVMEVRTPAEAKAARQALNRQKIGQ